MPRKLRVAIVHDWLIGGGAERVVLELHRMFPDAPIYTSCATDEWRRELDGKVVTGFLQNKLLFKLRKFVGILRIWWFSHLDLSGYDLVISSSGNGEAFGVRPPKGVKHICYCHTPTHYYWRHYDTYMRHPGFGAFDPLARIGLRLLLGPLRRWDYKAAQRVDYFIANSTHIQSDIRKFYGRASVVIHPPVDIARFATVKTDRREGFVAGGRLAPMKRNDIIVEACTKLNLPLTIFGKGPDLPRLQKLAGSNVKFAGFTSDKETGKLFAGACGFIFASQDDFGITPVEAMMTGTPVIAYQAGGALDYVQEGKTGVFFAQQTTASLVKALKSFDANKFNSQQIAHTAHHFSPDTFRKNLSEFINSIS
jgi:glycosyltransferase involved in cell wall biosynthesis